MKEKVLPSHKGNKPKLQSNKQKIHSLWSPVADVNYIIFIQSPPPPFVSNYGNSSAVWGNQEAHIFLIGENSQKKNRTKESGKRVLHLYQLSPKMTMKS